jgi:acyl carrier protein
MVYAFSIERNRCENEPFLSRKRYFFEKIHKIYKTRKPAPLLEKSGFSKRGHAIFEKMPLTKREIPHNIFMWHGETRVKIRKDDFCMMMEKIAALLATQFDVDPDSITADTDFVEDLNADSLDVVDMLMSLEDEFDVEIPDEEIENIHTVGDLVSFIEEHM